ncbi:MAG: hypothetical protein ACLUKN_13945 [Bacilli bacterium]
MEELLVSKPIMPEESRGAVYEWLANATLIPKAAGSVSKWL